MHMSCLNVNYLLKPQMQPREDTQAFKNLYHRQNKKNNPDLQASWGLGSLAIDVLSRMPVHIV